MVNCPFKIISDNYKRRDLPTQRNALRVEAIFCDSARCTLKPPKNWPENRIETLLINGDIEYFGYCENPCPEKIKN